jgi:stage V sporulation protein R
VVLNRATHRTGQNSKLKLTRATTRSAKIGLDYGDVVQIESALKDVDAIHDDRGFRGVRRELAKQYDVGFIDATIEVVDVDLAGDRRLMLRHAVVKGARLNETDARRVLQHLADLRSYDVSLVEVDAADKVLEEYVASPRWLAAAA